MPATLRIAVCRLCVFVGILLPSIALAQAQKPLLYLSVSNPAGPLLLASTKDFTSVLTPLQKQLEANGYPVVMQPDTLRRLLKQFPKTQFLYADVVCYQTAGSLPAVVFAVRDTLNKLWFSGSESTALFVSQQKAFASAARHLAEKLPATFTARPGQEAPANRGPQFMAYDNFQFTSYLYHVLAAAPLRQQLKRGTRLQLAIRIDEQGIATLHSVDSRAPLEAATRRALEQAVRNTLPWSPALVKGRRTAMDIQTTIGQGTEPQPAAE